MTGLTAPSRPDQGSGGLERPAQSLVVDAAFGDNATIDQDDRHAPVVLRVELLVRVDVAQLWLEAERAQRRKRLVAEVAALARDEHDGHVSRLPEAWSGRQAQSLPHLDDRST